jgi:AraC-like DNA-binding protein
MHKQETQEKPKIWQPTDYNVTLWRGCNSGGVLPRHSHEEFQLVLSLADAYEYNYQRRNLIVPPGHLAVIQSGEPHSSWSDDLTGQALRLMFFAPDILQRVATEVIGSVEAPVFPHLVVADRHVLRLFLQLHITLENQTSRLESETLILNLLTQLVLRCAEDRPAIKLLGQERQYVNLIREYIEDNYAENISLEQLAQIVDLSPEHLVRVFTAQIGLPPHTYQTQVRISRAKNLLKQGYAIAHVSHHTGFADQAHFTRHFKRLNGVTPGVYRLHIKNVQD